MLRWHAFILLALAALNAVSCLQPMCKPQGLLALDKPYPPAQYTQLPFCEQYSCSCCNRTHALLIYKSLIHLDDEADFGNECREYLRLFSCAVCDPEVGVGLKQAACQATCDSWYTACRGHFFGYDPHTQHLVPCTEHRASQGLHICSRLEELVPHGSALCRSAGFDVQPTQPPASSADPPPPCFDGTPTPARLPFCQQPKDAPRRPGRRRRSADTRKGAGPPGMPELDTMTWFVLVAALSLTFTTVLPRVLAWYQRWHEQRERAAAVLRFQDPQQLGQALLGRPAGLQDARAAQQEQLWHATVGAAAGKGGVGGPG